ncbi:glycosyltransferase family 4 protein [Indiicoccus explosivorum]|uniref:glycosyltransferase family 4 protein n=1 Tax=Indiicoccus explosivorum TaxID=1917864 RepID=UPI000B44DC24|nr:glycosyltransferase family 4 protein [Indiicoccus explosivorum]
MRSLLLPRAKEEIPKSELPLMATKRIIFVATVYQHLLNFHLPYMKRLKDNGYEVWAAGAKENKASSKLVKLGYTCFDIPVSREPLDLCNIRAFLELTKLFKKVGFDLIHVHTPIASLLTRLAFRGTTNGKVIYTAHGFHFYRGAPFKNWLLYYPVERLASKWTDYLITINEEDYKRAQKMGYRKGSIHFIQGIGVDIPQTNLNNEEKKTLRHSLGIEKKHIVISYVAELNKNKNHHYLLENWKSIKQTCPEAYLLIIGEGSERGKLESFIKKGSLEDVKLLGYRNDVQKLLQITDIMSLLSFREGLPKSVMEAKMAKLPCIVSDVRGLRDLITHGEDGYIVPHKQGELLISAFAELIKNTETRAVMGENALTNIKPYRMESVIKDYMEVYVEALNGDSLKLETRCYGAGVK